MGLLTLSPLHPLHPLTFVSAVDGSLLKYRILFFFLPFVLFLCFIVATIALRGPWEKPGVVKSVASITFVTSANAQRQKKQLKFLAGQRPVPPL